MAHCPAAELKKAEGVLDTNEGHGVDGVNITSSITSSTTSSYSVVLLLVLLDGERKTVANLKKAVQQVEAVKKEVEAVKKDCGVLKGAFMEVWSTILHFG